MSLSKWSLPNLSAVSAECLLSFGHSPDSGRQKIVHLFQKLWKYCIQFQLTHDQRLLPTSSLFMYRSFALSEQLKPFLHILLVHCTFCIHWTTCLWISAGRTFLVFKNPKIDSTSQVVGFLLSSLVTTVTEGKIMTPYCAIHITLVLLKGADYHFGCIQSAYFCKTGNIFPLAYRLHHITCMAAMLDRFLLSVCVMYSRHV
jgi:hypothetical protein